MRAVRLVVLSATVVALSGVASTASGATPRLRLQPRVVHPGAIVHVRGNADGCPRGDRVFILSKAFTGHVFAGVGGATARVRAGGSFATVAHVRRKAHGTYRVTARCGGGNLGVAPKLKVL